MNVEVFFEAVPDGTRVSLEHRGWERLGERGAKTRDNFNSGWDLVLALYMAAASKRADEPRRVRKH